MTPASQAEANNSVNTTSDEGNAECRKSVSDSEPLEGASDSTGQEPKEEGNKCDTGTLEQAEKLARWLQIHLDLPGVSLDEDWTPKHTEEFWNWCNDRSRMRCFFWADSRKNSTTNGTYDEDEGHVKNCKPCRLRFADSLPPHGVVRLVQNQVSQNDKLGVLFVAKRRPTTVCCEKPHENLVCQLVVTGALEQVAAFARGVCVPLLTANKKWPASLRGDTVQRVG